MRYQNPNCDGAYCNNAIGEVRLLPTSSSPDHGNVILCRSCFNHEINWRIQRNLELAQENWFKLPRWSDLAVYGGAR